jgi:hypothetical protein
MIGHLRIRTLGEFQFDPDGSDADTEPATRDDGATGIELETPPTAPPSTAGRAERSRRAVSLARERVPDP